MFIIFNSNLLKIIGNNITLDILEYLNNDDIKRLIPKIGEQILFRVKLKDFLDKKSKVRKYRFYVHYNFLNINFF